jgi:hypothetical protein
MAILIRPGKRFRKARAGNGAEILKKLEDYLKTASSEPVELLCGFWKDQSNAITYQELRQAVLDGELDEKTADEWMQDYSLLVQGKLNGMWQNAIIAGSTSQPIIQALADMDYIFSTKQVLGWIQERGAELVTQCTDTQKEAIKVFLERTVRERHSVDELAKMIRPCIGLTKPQAQANLKYYENMVKTLREQHPRMKAESIQKKARTAAMKYAERQHRQRADNIAQTEMAYAYNKGADESVRQAQEQKLIGEVIKRWSTSGDDMVCSLCSSLEGVTDIPDFICDFSVFYFGNSFSEALRTLLNIIYHAFQLRCIRFTSCGFCNRRNQAFPDIRFLLCTLIMWRLHTVLALKQSDVCLWIGSIVHKINFCDFEVFQFCCHRSAPFLKILYNARKAPSRMPPCITAIIFHQNIFS